MDAFPSSLDDALDRLRSVYGPGYRVSLRATFDPDSPEPSAIEARFERVPEPSRPETPKPGRLLTLDEVAGVLNVSRRTVNTVVAEGDLAVVHVRTQPRVTPEALDAYLRCATAR